MSDNDQVQGVNFLIHTYGEDCSDVPESALVEAGITVLPNHTYAMAYGDLVTNNEDGVETAYWSDEHEVWRYLSQYNQKKFGQPYP